MKGMTVPQFFFALLAILILATLAVGFTGCAQTALYKDGQRIATFQGDMTGTEYAMAADGSVKWKSATVNHSAATLAQGEAAKGKITAAGAAVATSGLTLLLK
jgi:hypothetical protein